MRYKLGILGGMGPLATAKLYERIINLTSASCDQDHIEMIILNNCKIPDRTSAIINGTASPIDSINEGINTLIQNGCENFIIPCNTAHYFKDKFILQGKINFIDMVLETKEYLKEVYPFAKVCVLATLGTVKSKIYDSDYIYYPCENVQNEVMNIIYNTKAGLDMTERLNKLITNDKYDIYLLACTELSIYKDKLNGNVIDALDILAVKTIIKSGKTPKTIL